MTRPLYDKIQEYAQSVQARFCMPGHSGAGIQGQDLFGACKFDWTEVAGLDNLLQSEDVILQSEKLMASAYGYKHCIMLTEGSTRGMHIAINIAKESGKDVVAFGNMHKSFWGACQVFGVNAYSVDNEEVLKSVAKEKTIGAIFVTTPDYFGNVKDLTELKNIAKSIGALLVVDEAHSAHFVFSKLLPDNASRVADIALVSMHKTLPVYGSGAILCVNSDTEYEQARKYRDLLHSTSPNYLVMASMDYARDYMQKNGEKLYKDLYDKIKSFADNLKTGKVLHTQDFSRVIIQIPNVDCYKVSDELIKRGFFVEMAYGDRLVLIVTPFNADKLQDLGEQLQSIKMYKEEPLRLPELVNVNTLSNDTEYVDIDMALGRICASEIGIYPPGIPAIKRGDVLDSQGIEFLKKHKERLFGLARGKVAVIK